MNKAILISIYGWYGVAAILGAYAFVIFEVISASSYIYQLLNLTGAMGIVFETAYKRDKQPLVLNAAWAIIALAAIVQSYIN